MKEGLGEEQVDRNRGHHPAPRENADGRGDRRHRGQDRGGSDQAHGCDASGLAQFRFFFFFAGAESRAAGAAVNVRNAALAARSPEAQAPPTVPIGSRARLRRRRKDDRPARSERGGSRPRRAPPPKSRPYKRLRAPRTLRAADFPVARSRIARRELGEKRENGGSPAAASSRPKSPAISHKRDRCRRRRPTSAAVRSFAILNTMRFRRGSKRIARELNTIRS